MKAMTEDAMVLMSMMYSLLQQPLSGVAEHIALPSEERKDATRPRVARLVVLDPRTLISPFKGDGFRIEGVLDRCAVENVGVGARAQLLKDKGVVRFRVRGLEVLLRAEGLELP